MGTPRRFCPKCGGTLSGHSFLGCTWSHKYVDHRVSEITKKLDGADADFITRLAKSYKDADLNDSRYNDD